MRQPTLTIILLLLILCPTVVMANTHKQLFDAVSAANDQTQPGLKNYLVTVETTRISEMMQQLTRRKPYDIPDPPKPVMKKFWQRDGKGLIYADQVNNAPYVEQMAKQISGNLAVELNKMLLPNDKKELREKLLKDAEIKVSEVALAETKIQHLEITFPQPADLQEAFYVSGMRLPQNQVKSLSFDIDATKNTVSELKIATGAGLLLTVEIRYVEVAGGFIPERYQVTSPDGKIDDTFKVTFLEADGFSLPATMTRKLRRPNLNEDLEIIFKDYQINIPVSAELKARLESQ